MPDISPNVVILTRDELRAREDGAFRRGAATRPGTTSMETGLSVIMGPDPSHDARTAQAMSKLCHFGLNSLTDEEFVSLPIRLMDTLNATMALVYPRAIDQDIDVDAIRERRREGPAPARATKGRGQAAPARRGAAPPPDPIVVMALEGLEGRR